MGRGRRYEEPKLNIKKVIAVIVALIVFVMCIVMLVGLFDNNKDSSGKISSISYFASYKDNKWGVINSKGETVIEPSYQEMIIIPNSKNDIFLCTYNVNYETGEYSTKALNSKNQEIFTEYKMVEAIQNTDESNNLWYEDNVLKVMNDTGKYGLIDYNGKQILECEYDEISAMPGIENSLITNKDGKLGVVGLDGQQVLPNSYEEITILGEDNKSGFIVKNDEGKYGIVDYSNNLVLEIEYEGIEKIYKNDLYVVIEDGNQMLIKKDGTKVLTSGFDTISQILKKQDAGIIAVRNGKYGVIDLSGNVVIPFEYESLSEAKTDILIAKKDGMFGVIDIDGSVEIDFKYVSLTYNENADIYIAENADYTNELLDSSYQIRLSGILVDFNTDKAYIKIKQDGSYKYYNFKFEEKNVTDILSSNTLFLSKQNGKYGFVDKNGNVVVDYIYDDATEQNSYGYAGIKKDGKWGAVDGTGKVVVDTIYDLDDYLLVNFIGKWHLGKDININYYNQL